MRKLLYKEAVYLVAGPTLGGAGVQAISLQSVLGRLPVPAGRLGGGGEGHSGRVQGRGGGASQRMPGDKGREAGGQGSFSGAAMGG